MRRRSGPRVALAVALALAAGCATLADGTAGLDNPPSARVGPFRLLGAGELGANQAPPFAMKDGTRFYRDPAVVDDDGDEATFGVTGYFAGVMEGADPNAPTDHLARFVALDGRSFQRPGEIVLTASEPWMNGHVGAPSAVRTTDGWLLYFESGGGIGLATSSDGVTFTVAPGPIVDGESPSVVVLADGTFDMFFERGGAIREATSTDGRAWMGVEEDLGMAGTSAPSALLRESQEGRPILDVYFTVKTETGAQIGLASRFLDEADGPTGRALERSSSIMLAPSAALDVREATVVRFEGFTLLFATENASRTSTEPAVVVGAAPGTFTLPAANPP